MQDLREPTNLFEMEWQMQTTFENTQTSSNLNGYYSYTYTQTCVYMNGRRRNTNKNPFLVGKKSKHWNGDKVYILRKEIEIPVCLLDLVNPNSCDNKNAKAHGVPFELPSRARIITEEGTTNI